MFAIVRPLDSKQFDWSTLVLLEVTVLWIIKLVERCL